MNVSYHLVSIFHLARTNELCNVECVPFVCKSSHYHVYCNCCDALERQNEMSANDTTVQIYKTNFLRCFISRILGGG